MIITRSSFSFSITDSSSSSGVSGETVEGVPVGAASVGTAGFPTLLV